MLIPQLQMVNDAKFDFDFFKEWILKKWFAHDDNEDVLLHAKRCQITSNETLWIFVLCVEFESKEWATQNGNFLFMFVVNVVNQNLKWRNELKVHLVLWESHFKT